MRPGLPSAADFKLAVRNCIHPVLRPLAYAIGGKGTLSWTRRRDGERTSLIFRREPRAVDPYQGGRFSIEFEHTTTEIPRAGLNGRAYFDQLLESSERDRVIHYQNAVISSLPHPPAQHIAVYPEQLRDTYLSGFEPEGPVRPGALHMRFLTMEDLLGWLALIALLLPAVLDRADRLDPTVLYLASPIDLDANPLRPTNPVVLRQSAAP